MDRRIPRLRCTLVAMWVACACAPGTPDVPDAHVGPADSGDHFMLPDGDDTDASGIDVVTTVDDAPVTPPDAGSQPDATGPGADSVAGQPDAATADGGPGCAGPTGCDTCAPLAGCGWCRATSSCLPGTVSGPATGACATWVWAVAQCTTPTDPCASQTDCGSCTGMTACGWCGATGRCQSGTSTGPTGSTCAGSWAWTVSECTALPGDSCSSHGSCIFCTGDSSCGWCRDSATCHQGSSSGPTDHGCAHGSWGWSILAGACL